MVIGIIIGVVVLVIIVALIVISNGLNRAVVKIDEASSGIDVALTKRYDVLTKMIDTVKSYTKYEKETIFEAIEIRQGMSIDEKNKVNDEINKQLNQVIALAENYPDLKASENYNTLQKAIADVEEHLQAARRVYNANVSIYNQKLVTFPSSVIANSRGMTRKEFFEAEPLKKQDVKIDL